MLQGPSRRTRRKGLARHGNRRKNAGMLQRLVIIAVCAGAVSACVPSRRPVAEVPPESVPTKHIVRSGTDLVLPDGTRVTPDSSGGFALPNGDYVRREARGGLRLPNGALCAPISSGYACP